MRECDALRSLVRLLLLFGAILLLPAALFAQSGGGMGASAANENVGWYVIAGGGVVGSQNGSGVLLSGTVGQGIIGRVTNSTGNVTYEGFWLPLPGGVNSVPGSPIVTGTRSRLRNYPNPFSSMTTIAYHLGERGRVRLEVFNGLGQSVRLLVDELKESGDYTVEWNGFDASGSVAPSGSYIYRVSIQPLGPIGSESFSEQNQMIIVR